jgi:hypothetical protein
MSKLLSLLVASYVALAPPASFAEEKKADPKPAAAPGLTSFGGTPTLMTSTEARRGLSSGKTAAKKKSPSSDGLKKATSSSNKK